MKELHLKVIIVGDKGVGKTTLVKRVVEGKFTPALRVTIGVDYATTSWTLHDHPIGHPITIKADFTDIAGQDSYPAIASTVMTGAKAVFVVTSYPVSTASLKRAGQWIKAAQDKHRDSSVLPFYLLVNKCDMCGTEKGVGLMRAYDPMLTRFVNGEEEECTMFDPAGLKGYRATSAKDGTNLPDACREWIENLAKEMGAEALAEPDDGSAPKWSASTSNRPRSDRQKAGCPCKT